MEHQPGDILIHARRRQAQKSLETQGTAKDGKNSAGYYDTSWQWRLCSLQESKSHHTLIGENNSSYCIHLHCNLGPEDSHKLSSPSPVLDFFCGGDVPVLEGPDLHLIMSFNSANWVANCDSCAAIVDFRDSVKTPVKACNCCDVSVLRDLNSAFVNSMFDCMLLFCISMFLSILAMDSLSIPSSWSVCCFKSCTAESWRANLSSIGLSNFLGG